MKPDCKNFDDCEVLNLSDCCGAPIMGGDICYDCREHCSDTCEECDLYEPETIEQ